MSNTKNNTQPIGITDKIRSSLVIKLNIQMIWRLFLGFLLINILIFFISIIVVLWKVEEGAQRYVEIINNSSAHISLPYYNLGNYQILIVEGEAEGILLPGIIQELLPVKASNAKRSFEIPAIAQEAGFWKRVELVQYKINFSLHNINYQIIYALASDLKLLFFLFSIILVFEGLILINNITKGTRAIRKILKPLSDMAKTAKSINAEVSSMSSGHIKDLAGVISNIDANRLDRRISVDSSQKELKDLAIAINNMLNRISASYQSQVRFVSDASHELRTPISVIQGYVNLLDRWGKKDPKIMQEAIDAIKTESESMKELIEALLFLARGDNETIVLHKETVDSCEIVDEVIRETKMIDQSHNFETNLTRPAYIDADRQLFKQLVRILVDNSIKYTPVGEKVSLKVLSKEGFVHISVQDNGIGIAPEDLPHIFDRFYRSDTSRARKTGGSGLGLSIAKWIVQRHEGYLEVLSRVDIGTRITIVIPEAKLLDNKAQSRE